MEEVYSLSQPKTTKPIVRLAHYDINIELLQGKENVIADASVESVHYSLTTLRSKTPTLMSSQYTTSHTVHQ